MQFIKLKFSYKKENNPFVENKGQKVRFKEAIVKNES